MSLRHSTREDWSNGSALLRGRYVGIEPLSELHIQPLEETLRADSAVAVDENVPPPANVRAYVGGALIDQANGLSVPFALRDSMGTIVGSARYMELSDKRLEIGHGWCVPRTKHIAFETALLLLTHAFESMGCDEVKLEVPWMGHEPGQWLLAKHSRTIGSHSSLLCDRDWPGIRRLLRAEVDNSLKPELAY